MFRTASRLLTVGVMAGAVAVAGIGTASAKSTIDIQVGPRSQHVGQWFGVHGAGISDSTGLQRFCVQERYGSSGAWQTTWCGRIVDSTRQEATAYGSVRAGHLGTLELRGVLQEVQHPWGGRTWQLAETAPVTVHVVR
ncbi:hypothetical protein [Streptacidiphilus rugosus]|uniref:hypothetical protein n=1 Tax=Streptacidiphilus rugosus TaxID=405783 RepID=UPI00068C4C7D|nr:hypothetical protein [Streptacidiphilus rugosus]